MFQARSGNMNTRGRGIVTQTMRVTAGTPSYIAPELVPGERKLEKASVSDFMRADIWSFGLVLHALMNPGSPPMYAEIEEYCDQADDFINSFLIPVTKFYANNHAPSMMEEYQQLRARHWGRVFVAYIKCTHMDATKRITALEAVDMLGSPVVQSFSYSQMSAIEITKT